MKKRATERDELPSRWKGFLDEYYRNGFKGGRAYAAVYPGVTKKSAEVCASRLLRKASIRQEVYIRSRVEEIESFEVIARLKEIGEMKVGNNKAAVKAIIVVAKIRGMFRKKENTRNIPSENVAVFLPPR